MQTFTAETFHDWHREVLAILATHDAVVVDELPLQDDFALGLTPQEVYLWHVRAPELPDHDVYLDA